MRYVRIALVCFVCLAAVPAQAKKNDPENVGKTIYTNYRLNFVKLENLSGKERERVHPSHPANVSIGKMREMLAAIRLSRRAFFKKEKIVEDRALFDDEALATLTPHLVQGLRRATDKEIVAFSYLFKNPRFVLRNDRFTSGKMWMEGDDLHVEFVKVYAQLTGDIDKRGYDTKIASQAKSLRILLELGPGMTFGRSKRELVLNTKETFVAAGDNKFKEQTTEGRLEELTRLRDMGLITKEEYEAKRRAILNQL